MIFVHNLTSARNKISDDSADEATSGIARKRCRNPLCRSKLPTPVENEHHAFCTRGCYESFYRTRCRVCERDLRKTGKRGDENRRYCRPPNRCASEARKWPEKYGFGVLPLSPPSNARRTIVTSILRALFPASRATDRAIGRCASGHGIPTTWSTSFGSLLARCLLGSKATAVDTD